MKNQPSIAMVKGLMAQLTASVMPMPRQCFVTWPSAPKSIFTSIGMIISQISTATGMFTFATSMALMAPKTPGITWPSSDARNDAEEDPDGEVAFEEGHEVFPNRSRRFRAGRRRRGPG